MESELSALTDDAEAFKRIFDGTTVGVELATVIGIFNVADFARAGSFFGSFQVATRVATLATLLTVPALKLVVSLPAESVVPEPIPKSPMSDLKVIDTPDSATLDASTAVTVIVAESELSDRT